MYSLRLALLLVLSAGSLITSPGQTGAQETRGTELVSSRPVVTQYTLPPELLRKAHGLYISEIWLGLGSGIYSLIILAMMIRGRWVVRFRKWAEAATRNSFLRAAIIVPLFAVSFSLLMLPPSLYGHQLSRNYGISVQSWPSWFRDWSIGLLLTVVVGTFLGWILYSVIRRSPRRWWLWFWLAVIPISVFLTFIAPEVIDPMFNNFEPLQNNHPQLVAGLEAVAHRGGLEIPPSRMYEMKASQKVTGSNAYVTGFGATKRVVVWDTAIEKMTRDQLLFVFGHEMGHYVLNHIVYGFVFTMALFLVIFYLLYRLATWRLGRWGTRFEIMGLGDWASLPVLLFIIFVLGFLSEPVANAYSRHLEHQADQYGLEVVNGLFPNSGEVAAQSFQKLGEEWLEYPYVSKLAVIWEWNHPTISERIHFALTYDPWDRGKQPEFVPSNTGR